MSATAGSGPYLLSLSLSRFDPVCVKTHTFAKCRKHNSPTRHRTRPTRAARAHGYIPQGQALAPPQCIERIAEIVLDHGPVERRALAGCFLQGSAMGRDR